MQCDVHMYLKIVFCILVVFMDEAGLPEESHESLKVTYSNM